MMYYSIKFLAQGRHLLVLPKTALHSDLCLRADCRKLAPLQNTAQK